MPPVAPDVPLPAARPAGIVACVPDVGFCPFMFAESPDGEPPALLAPGAPALPLSVPAEPALLSEGLLPLSKMPPWPPELGVIPPFSPAELRAPLTPPTLAGPVVAAALLSEGLLPLSKMPSRPPELGVIPPFNPAELRAPLTPPTSAGWVVPAELVAPFTAWGLVESVALELALDDPTLEPLEVLAAPAVPPLDPMESAPEPRLRTTG